MIANGTNIIITQNGADDMSVAVSVREGHP